MNKIKRFLFVLVLVFVLIGVYGCMKTSNKETRAERVKGLALEYLNTNYSDTFSAILYSSSNWAYDFESIVFTAEKYPDEVIEVRAYKDENGVYTFIDNYYHCYMLEDAISYANSLVPSKNVVKARFPNTVWSDELLGAQSFDEWKANGKASVDFFFVTAEELTIDSQTEIADKLARDKIHGRLVFFTTDDKDLLQELSLDEILNNQGKYTVTKSKYHIDGDVYHE